MPTQDALTPNLSSYVAQGGVADAAGGSTYSGAVTSEAAGDVAFGGPTVDTILFGAVNGSFAQGPPDPASNIDPINNPLPYWTGPTVVGGGAITCTWVVDASSPSGYNLRFNFIAGAANDEVYFEQIIPIGGSRWLNQAHSVRATFLRVTATSNNFSTSLALTYLSASGAALDATSNATGFTADGQVRSLSADKANLTATAAYLRIRVGMYRNTAATTDTGTFDLTDLRVTRSLDLAVLGDQDGTGTFSHGTIYQTGGVLQFAPQRALAATLSTSALTLPAATLTVGGKTTLGAAIIGSSIITPSIGANQDNYAPAGSATCSGIAITLTGATRTITGISATGFTDGQMFWISCLGFDLVLADASASSTSGNRFSCPGAVNFTIRVRGGVWIVYSTTASTTSPFRVLAP